MNLFRLVNLPAALEDYTWTNCELSTQDTIDGRTLGVLLRTGAAYERLVEFTLLDIGHCVKEHGHARRITGQFGQVLVRIHHSAKRVCVQVDQNEYEAQRIDLVCSYLKPRATADD